MAEPHVISGLKAKRARVAGEIIQAQEIVSRRTKELLAIDAVLLLFSPDCDPDMIPPIRPATRGLFFQYRELGWLCLGILTRADGPITLEQIVDQIVEAKGVPDDRRVWRRVYGVTRQSLLRRAQKGRVRRIVEEPDQWWELVT